MLVRELERATVTDVSSTASDMERNLLDRAEGLEDAVDARPDHEAKRFQ